MASDLASVERAEEQAVSLLFASLEKPLHLVLERCRLYPSLLECILETPAGQSSRSLEIDNVLNRFASRRPGGPESLNRGDTPFSLECLPNLRVLRLGAADATLVQHIPPALDALDILTVNTFGALDWLKEHISLSIASKRRPFPDGFRLTVSDNIAPVYRDGPKGVREMPDFSSYVPSVEPKHLKWMHCSTRVMSGAPTSSPRLQHQPCQFEAAGTRRAICGRRRRDTMALGSTVAISTKKMPQTTLATIAKTAGGVLGCRGQRLFKYNAVSTMQKGSRTTRAAYHRKDSGDVTVVSTVKRKRRQQSQSNDAGPVE